MKQYLLVCAGRSSNRQADRVARTVAAGDFGATDLRGMQGTTKRLKISRSVMDGSGKSQRVQVPARIVAIVSSALEHEDAALVTLLVGHGLTRAPPIAAGCCRLMRWMR